MVVSLVNEGTDHKATWYLMCTRLCSRSWKYNGKQDGQGLTLLEWMFSRGKKQMKRSKQTYKHGNLREWLVLYVRMM